MLILDRNFVIQQIFHKILNDEGLLMKKIYGLLVFCYIKKEFNKHANHGNGRVFLFQLFPESTCSAAVYI